MPTVTFDPVSSTDQPAPDVRPAPDEGPAPSAGPAPAAGRVVSAAAATDEGLAPSSGPAPAAGRFVSAAAATDAARPTDPGTGGSRPGWMPGLAKLARYGAVSGVSTGVTLTLLVVLVHGGRVDPGWANVLATAAGTVPSFEGNRRFVWRRAGRPSLRREVLPFCALSLAELVLSTAAVGGADGWARASGLGHDAMAVVAAAANLITYGTLWVVQFLVLQRVLFADRR